VDNPNLQKATSTKEEDWVPVKLLLSDNHSETGQGRYTATGLFEVLLETGLQVLIPPDQQHRIQTKENVDVGPFVAPLANSVELSQTEPYEENVDLLAPTTTTAAPSPSVEEPQIDISIPWHTFPLAEVKEETEVTPQEIAHQVQSQLLTCQSPHHFHQLTAQFGQIVIDWVLQHLLPGQRPSLLSS
ncbi:hypothetical protein IQ225_18295, partial [Synechocystis salina LEGE 06155]|nr:hypothetical protein [Synechocystis salina LEGE 06155]